MPGLYSIVEALQDIRAELKGASDDAEAAAENVRDYSRAVEEAAETSSEKTRAAGGGPVSLKGLSAAIGAVTGRT